MSGGTESGSGSVSVIGIEEKTGFGPERLDVYRTAIEVMREELTGYAGRIDTDPDTDGDPERLKHPGWLAWPSRVLKCSAIKAGVGG